jgi:hypothetical protein
MSMVRRKNWRLLAIVGLGILPFYLIFPHGLGTSRHLFYYAPFFALPAVVAVWDWRPASKTKRLMFAVLVAFLLVAQYAFGLYRLTTDDGDRHLRMRLGPGEERVTVTNNGGRLMTGIGWSPVWHRQEKQTAQHREHELSALLDDNESLTATLYAVGWTSGQRVIKVLLGRGYMPQEIDKDRATNWTRYRFRHGERTVDFVNFISPGALDRTLESTEPRPLPDFDRPGTDTWKAQCVVGQYLGQTGSESICVMKTT